MSRVEAIRSGLLAAAFVLGSSAGSGIRGAAKPDYPVHPVPFTDVRIADRFWAPRRETNRLVTIPSMLRTYARQGQSPWSPFLEGVAATLAEHPDPPLRRAVEEALGRIAAELMDSTPALRWKHLLNGDLISAGHFFEAAIAYHRATGDRKFLDAARRIADDIASVFGPNGRRDVSNHEEVKIGLVRLYRATGEERYLDLARFFLDRRGRAEGRRLFGEYAQDHEPVVDQRAAVGHAVRAAYLYAPLMDVAALTGAAAYAKAGDAIWEDAASRKAYLTGGIGSHRDLEDFGAPYELPNLGAWNETCAANGNVLWNHRMFLFHRDAKYVDMMERILYNAFLAGVGLGGDRFLYQNPLMALPGFTRQPWFGPNCCPPNVVRGLALVGDYVYAWSGPDIYVNLFIQGEAVVGTDAGPVRIRQETDYPWGGTVTIRVEPGAPRTFALYVRIPGWARGEAFPSGLYTFLDPEAGAASLRINGSPLGLVPDKGYARIEREWRAGDVVDLTLPMPVRRVRADERVEDDRGLVALQRGPLVYCLEPEDNGGSLSDLLLPDEAALAARFDGGLLGGVVLIEGRADALRRASGPVTRTPRGLRAIPYFAWGNRADGGMSVWLARDPSRVRLSPVPTLASRARAASSCGNGSVDESYPGGRAPSIAERFYPRAQSGAVGLEALSDQATVTGSRDGSGTYFRLRPVAGDTAWVEYAFASPAEVSSTRIYWKDDGELCVLPRSWRVLYRKDGRWHPVVPREPYELARDRFCAITFDRIRTDGLRLEVVLDGRAFPKGGLGPPDGNYLPADVVWYEGGIIEWEVR